MVFEWEAAVERNHDLLKGIVATMVAMLGVVVQADAARPAIPRHLHQAIVRVLRPAEAAVRRLIIVAARSVKVPLPRVTKLPLEPRRPRPPAVHMPYATRLVLRAAAIPRPLPSRMQLPLCDTLRPLKARRKTVLRRDAPRISLPGLTARYVPPPRQSPYDMVNTARLNLRINALTAVLDDLPAHARRFARWRARRDALLALRDSLGDVAGGAGHAGAPLRGGIPGPAFSRPRRPKVIRLTPLRPGRPPGYRRRQKREVHEVLDHLQYFAYWALERPDTS